MYEKLKKYSEFNNIEETITFMENVWKFWSIHDISNLTQHTRGRMEDKAPFQHSRDGRLSWLEEEFPLYLELWKKNAGPKQFLTDETYKALVLTCKSTAGSIRFLLENGLKFVLTRKFSTDAIERFFGSIRAQNGGNDIPTAEKCMHAVNRIVRTGIGFASVHGNVPIEKPEKKKKIS